MSCYSSTLLQSYGSPAVKKINKLVHILLQTQYDYTAVLANLRKSEESENGVRKYFKRRIEDTQSDLKALIKIQQQIGGRVVLPELSTPTKVQYDSIQEIMEDALVKEKLINKNLLKLHSLVTKEVQEPVKNESIEEMLQDRDQHIQQIVEHILHLEQNQGKVGEFLVSKLLKKEHTRIRKIRVEEKLVEITSESSRQQTKSQLPQQSQMRSSYSSSSSSSRRRRNILSSRKRLAEPSY